ncbi:hypothetical protein [uncultured Lamprocystis sp.]|uniref:hypothetical protein n=1 Tax=uncultured Lamprocystis sp. TaxID=543132 RepID=UPI0025E24CA1|nr:hypothetical protein [uncultured Lamprocystis sp.]
MQLFVVAIVTLAGIGFTAILLAAEPALNARAAAAGRQQAAGGWLQLEQDQRAVRRQAEPMTPPQSQQLEIQAQQERLRLRGTLQDQQRERDQATRARPRAADPGTLPPGQGARALGLQLRQARELEALRLRRGLDRGFRAPPVGGSLRGP